MTCEVSLTPDLSDPDTAVTVNGNHSIGDIVLNIDASSTIKAGMVLPIGEANYFILYTASGSSPTKLVLHKPLEKRGWKLGKTASGKTFDAYELTKI